MGRTLRCLVYVGVVVSLGLGRPAIVHAQRFDQVGVRAQGMAGAFVAVADDASATWWNPAGLATGLSFVDLTSEVDEGGGRGFALTLPSLGLSYYRLNISQIQPSGTTAQAMSGRQDPGAAGSSLPGARDVGVSQFGITVGQSLNSHLVVASTLKLVNAAGDTRADLDLGAMAALGVLRLGVTVRDLRQPTFGSGADAFDLARRGRAGAAIVTPPVGRLDSLVLSVDADLTTAPVAGRDQRDVAGGVEAWVLGRRIGVRGGLGANTVGDGDSFGAMGVSIVPYPRVVVDGAVTRGSDSARDRWAVDLRLTF